MQYIETVEYRAPARVKARVEKINYYPFHLHENCTEIICILRGLVGINDASVRYTLGPDDIHIFNPNDPHRIEAEDPDSLILTVQLELSHYQNEHMTPDQAYFLCDTFSSRDLYDNDMRLLRFYLANIYKIYTENGSDLALEKVTRRMLELLMEHFRQYTYLAEKSNPATIVRLQNSSQLYRDYERMYRIADYVEDNFRQPLRLTDIAEMEYLSSAHLSRYLKSTLGLSFSSFLSLIRCNEAARQLSSSKKTVDQIASEVGFSNRRHLAVQFRKWYDQTPTDYRNAILSDLYNSADTVRISSNDDALIEVIGRYLEEY